MNNSDSLLVLVTYNLEQSYIHLNYSAINII